MELQQALLLAQPLPAVEQAAGLEAVDHQAQRLALASGQISKPLRIRIQVRSFDAMCQMVAAGLGIAVLPATAAQPLAKALGLRQIELSDEWIERELLLGARELGALARPARKLLDHLVAGQA